MSVGYLNTKSMEDEESVVVEIIREICSKEGCEYNDLPPLYEVVKTEAITKLNRESDIHIQFSYVGYDIEIENQEVTINDSDKSLSDCS